MAYQALYRTWRPQKFSDMIGQEVVTKTLKNAIMTGQTSHAYLFNGPRGTGKTSAAKIFAKAVNCLHPIDGEPDGTCEICQAADNGTLGDVMELDAASNNSVEQIRDIREDVNYAPTMAKYKVYIIDEVHMLSTGAFNALLKTLEEPPANVIFILATTEPQKIPATIISRTQRFDFKRIDAQAAFDRMVYILNERQDTYDEAALRVIANAADGGMRDALSILDQTLSFGDGHVSLDNALLVTGSVTQTLLGEYVEAVVSRDATEALKKLSEVLKAGKDANRFVEDLISYARDLLLYTEAAELVSLVPDEHFKQLATSQDPLTWYHMIDVLNETQQQLRYTNRPSIYLEVLTVKLVQPVATQTTVAAPAQGAARSVAAPQPATTKPTQQPVSNQKSAEAVVPVEQPAPVTEQPVNAASDAGAVAHNRASSDKTAVFNVLRQATKGDLTRIKGIWADLIATLAVPKQAMLNVSQPVAAGPSGVALAFDFDVIRANAMRNDELQTQVMQQMQALTQSSQERQLVMINQEDWAALRSEYVQQMKQGGASEPVAQPVADHHLEEITEEPPATQDEPSNDVVQQAVNIFGSDIVEVVED